MCLCITEQILFSRIQSFCVWSGHGFFMVTEYNPPQREKDLKPTVKGLASWRTEWNRRNTDGQRTRCRRRPQTRKTTDQEDLDNTKHQGCQNRLYCLFYSPLANMSFPYAYHSLSVLFSAFNTSDIRFCEQMRQRSLISSLCPALIDSKKPSAS